MSVPTLLYGSGYNFIALLLLNRLLLLLGSRCRRTALLFLLAVFMFIKLEADPFALVLTTFLILVLLYLYRITVMEGALG